MRNISALIAGILFGIGLIVSDMTNPAKVLNFLNVTGSWDVSLAFVMVGAIAVTFLGFRYLGRRNQSFSGEALACNEPPSTKIDAKLMIGALMFGAGWGISGLCPGPSIAALPMALPTILPFTGGALLGLLAYAWFFDRD